jgi:hypothetical protein
MRRRFMAAHVLAEVPNNEAALALGARLNP